MVEMWKYFIGVVINAFNTIFFLEIPLSEDLNLPLGVFLISVAVFVILIILICLFFNINLGGDDE